MKISTKQFVNELKKRKIQDVWITSDNMLGAKYFVFKYYKVIKDFNQDLLEALSKSNNITVHVNDEKYLTVLKLFNDIKIEEENSVEETDLYIKEVYGSKNKWYRLLKFKNYYFKVDDFLYSYIINGYGSVYASSNESLDHILITNSNKDYLTICMRVKDIRGL